MLHLSKNKLMKYIFSLSYTYSHPIHETSYKDHYSSISSATFNGTIYERKQIKYIRFIKYCTTCNKCKSSNTPSKDTSNYFNSDSISSIILINCFQSMMVMSQLKIILPCLPWKYETIVTG